MSNFLRRKMWMKQRFLDCSQGTVMFNNRGKFISNCMLEHQCTWQGKDVVHIGCKAFFPVIKAYIKRWLWTYSSSP